MIRKAINRFVRFAEYAVVYSKGKIFGISSVVKYLRNPNPQLTVRLLRSFGANIGQGTTVKRSLLLDNTYEDENSSGDFSSITIGNNCYIGDGVFFDLANRVVMEDDVVMSGRVSVLTHADCNRSVLLAKKFPRQCQPVRICNGAWIGYQATILSGVNVGSQSVIGAHSLVRADVASQTLCAGVPAEEIKHFGNSGRE